MLGRYTALALRYFYAEMRENHRARHGVPAFVRDVQDHHGAVRDSIQYLILSVLFEMQLYIIPVEMRKYRSRDEIQHVWQVYFAAHTYR